MIPRTIFKDGKMHALKKCYRFLIIFTCCSILIQCQKTTDQNRIRIVDDILNDKQSHFYLDIENYPQNDPALPIGIFDSGTGGLTVMDAIVQFDQFDNDTRTRTPEGDGVSDFQNEYFIYLADQANMPYGNYGRENKINLLKEHIIKDARFLMDRKYFRSGDDTDIQFDKQPVKAIVIACNTATAYGKTDIKQFIKRADIDLKVIGVIDAGVRGALTLLDKKEDGTVAIMATAGTVASGGYVRTLESMKTAGGYTGNIAAIQQAGIGLAGAIDRDSDYIDPLATNPREIYMGPSETHPDAAIDRFILDRYGFNWDNNEMLYEGDRQMPKNLQINSVENYIAYHVTTLLEKMRQETRTNKLKTIILGCTHYPFYSSVIKKKLKILYDYKEDGKYIYRPYMVEEIALVDPAENTALELFEHLSAYDIFNDKQMDLSEFYISVPNRSNPTLEVDAAANFTYAYKYGRDEGTKQQFVKRVPFSRQTLSPDVIQRLSDSIPQVFELICHFNQSNPKTAYLPQEARIDF